MVQLEQSICVQSKTEISITFRYQMEYEKTVQLLQEQNKEVV